MREILEKLKRFLDDVARTDAVDMGDEADATRVVLVSRIVQSLLFRHPLSRSPKLPWIVHKKRAPSNLGEALCALSLQSCYESALSAQILPVAPTVIGYRLRRIRLAARNCI